MTSKIKTNFTLAAATPSATPYLQVSNPFGDVTVVAVERARIEVLASIEYDPSEYSEAEVQALLQLTNNGSEHELRMYKPNMRTALRTDLVISVPARTALQMKVSLGTVTVDGTVSDVRVHTSLGTVKLNGGRGNIFLESSAGAIEARNVQPSDQLRLQTSLGNINYQGAVASAENRIESSKGEITLRLPSDSQFHLHAHTSLGRVRSDFPITHSQHSFIGAKVEGGTIGFAHPATSLNIKTSLGDISLQRA